MTNNSNKHNMSKLGVVAKFTGAVDDDKNTDNNSNNNNKHNNDENNDELLMSAQLGKLTTTACQKITQQRQIKYTNENEKSIIYANANANANANSISFTSNVKATENKCLTSVYNSFSIERELNENASKPIPVSLPVQQALSVVIHAQSNYNNTVKCEFKEYADEEETVLQTGLQLQKQRLNLAQYKAKLKSDFFQYSITNKNSFESKNIKKIKDLKRLPIVVTSEVSKVRQLVEKFDKMKVNSTQTVQTLTEQMLTIKPDNIHQRHSPCSDEGCNLAQSPYSSSDEDNESICTATTTIEGNFKHKEKVARSASSDSALGLDVEEPNIPTETQTKRRMTLTIADLPLRPALLPLAEPTTLPDTPTTQELQQTLPGLLTQTAVPSKVLLEERVVELPVEDIRSSDICSISSSRRESTQSCISDYPLSECSGVRYMRTPSVVVSDYSDDVMAGITLEEIEYFRAKRVGRRCSSLDIAGTEREGDVQSDVSAASSCSNLYYCGSTISALDGNECYVNGLRMPLERKISDCSNSEITCNDDDNYNETKTVKEDHDLAALLAAQHLDNKQGSKKVGSMPTVVVSGADN